MPNDDFGTVLLETRRPDEQNRTTLLFREPIRCHAAYTLDDVALVLRAVDEAVRQGFYAAGYVTYEAGYAFEPVAEIEPSTLPLVWFGVYDAPLHLAAGAPLPDLDAAEGVAAVRDPSFALTRAAYRERIAAIKRHIRAGDVYQINFTGSVDFTYEGDPYAIYRGLCDRQRVAYGAYLDLGDYQILSLSPELFFRREGNRIETRPMKGTIHRGRTLAEDDALRTHLARDPKSQAENLMIVDLLRNDLSRICAVGSVEVPELFTTETYETLIQMTSTVRGTLRPGTSYADVFAALFPCGSVTGAPKRRAMDVLRTLEAAPRGVYCGAVGYIAPDDAAAFNVAIRTALLRDGRGTLGIGSGVVWDSDADAEYDECLLKAQFLTAPASPRTRRDFHLIETMRWEDGIALLADHRARLRASAAYFGFAFDADHFDAAVDAAVRGLPPGTPAKVRLLLGPEGAIEVATAPLEPPTDGPVRLAFADQAVCSADAFLFHKTTNRALYETAFACAVAAGFGEIVFCNEHGELTEGARSNIFVERDGQLLTPRLEAGVLDGVYRRHLLRSHPNAREAALTPADLRTADAIYVTNAVRGMRRAVVAAHDPISISTAPASASP